MRAVKGGLENITTGIAILSLAVLGLMVRPIIPTAQATTGVPKAFSYQGRLYDSGGNLLGGTGTAYCFKYSIYDNATVGSGTKLWPAGSPTGESLTVRYGVFNFNVGLGTDSLTYNFADNNSVYLDVQVATKVGALCTDGDETYETLGSVSGGRQQIVSAGYAINAGTANGLMSPNNASGASDAISTASGTGTTATGGLTFATGNASAGTAGNISLDVGTSSSGNGSILIGTASRAQTLTLGNTTSGTSVELKGLTINVGDTASTNAIDIGGNDNSGTDTIRIGTNATAADGITIGSTHASSTLSLEAGTGATAIQIGNGGTAHGIQIGTNATGDNDISIGGTNAGSTVTIESGTAATAIQIGTGATAHGIQIGNSASGDNDIIIGSANAGSTLTLDAGSAATAIQIGNGLTAHGIKIGTNANGDNDIVVGSTNAGSTLLFESGTAANAIQIGNGATAHGIQIGTGNADQDVILGSTGTGSTTTINGLAIDIGDTATTNAIDIGGNDNSGTDTIRIGTNATAQDVISIGSGHASSTLTLEAGTGATAIQIGNGATAHGIKIGTNATGDNDVAIGGTNSGSTLVFESGTAANAIQIGNGATAHGIQIGTGAADQDIIIGSTTTGSTTALKGVTITNTASTSLSILNSAGLTTMLVDNSGGNTNNLVTNPSFETDTSGWSAKTGCTISRVTTDFYNGVGSGQCDNTATANAGMLFTTGPGYLSANTNYTLSFYIKSSSFMNTMQAGRADDGTTDTNCFTNAQTVPASAWTRFSCTFRTGTSISNAPYIFVKQTDALARKLQVDAVLFTTQANAETNYRDAKISFSGTITSPVIIQTANNASTGLQVQTSNGATIFDIGTNDDSNVITNPGFEKDTSGWAYSGTAPSNPTPDIIRDTNQTYLGLSSLQVNTTANTNNGAKWTTGNTDPTQLRVSSTYIISWYDRLASGTFTDVKARYDRDGSGGGAPADCTSINTQTVSTAGWTRHTCTIATDATTPAADSYVDIVQTAATSRQFWLDGIALELASSASAYGHGYIFLNGIISNPIAIKSGSDSTTAFRLMNAAGTDYLAFDSLNTTLNLGATGSTAAVSTTNIGTTTSNNTQAINIGATGNTSNTVLIESGTGATAIQIGNGLTAHGIKIGSNNTGDNDISIGGTNSGSTFIVEGGTAAGAITIGNGTTAHGIQIGSNGTGDNDILIGGNNSGSTLTLDAGTAAGAIAIGNSTTAHGIKIGNDNTGDNDILIGGTNSGSTVIVEAGTAAGAITIGNGGTAHGIQIGTGNADQDLIIGSTGTGSTTTLQGLITNISDTATTNTIDIGGADNSGTDTVRIATNNTAADGITIGSTHASSTLTLEAGTGATAIQIGNGGTAHGIKIGTGAAIQTIVIGSNNSTSHMYLNSGNISTSTGVGGVVIGSDVTDANLVQFQLDSYNTFANVASSCTATVNQGAVFYNSVSTSVRACINGVWEDLASTGVLGLQMFGVVPDSGANPGDLAGVTDGTAFRNGPCKVSVGANTTTVSWTACIAYSGGRKVQVTASTATTTNSVANNFQHLCLTAANNQPALSTTGSEVANLATVSLPSVNDPILCLADIKFTGANNTITQIYDTRTYTTTTKETVSVGTTAPALGHLVNFSSTRGTVVPAGATANGLAGVIVASTGATSTTTINGIIATGGPAAVKCITGTNTVGSYILGSATAGYCSGNSVKPAETTGTIFNVLGVFRTAWTGATACAANSDVCSGSVLTVIDKR